MATIKVDRGFTQKTQQIVLSHKPSQPVAPAPKRAKPKSGLSVLTVSLIVAGSVLFAVAVGVVVVVGTRGKAEQTAPAAAKVLEPVVVPPAPVPAPTPQPAAAQKKPAAAKTSARPPVVQSKVLTGYSGQGSAFAFDGVPKPAENDAAASARFAVVDGEMDRASGGPSVLNDGRIPTDKDQPRNNFFFRKGADGGRLLVDLGRTVSIQQVNTYSWHSEMRGPQVYVLYGGDDESKDFVVDPGRSVDPATVGWRRLASVDTRPQSGPGSGQHGASIVAEKGTLGSYRFLLFVISATEKRDAFGNTFFSEFDVIEAGLTAPPVQAKAANSVLVFGDREVAPGSPQGLLCEFYDSITGSSVDDLRKASKYPAKPDWTLQIKKFELPEKQGEQYGARVRGFVVPPKTGSYTFVLNVDDGGEFWLSTDESPANLRRLIALAKHTSRKWTAFAEQQSEPCQLVAGQRYYLEAFVKQASAQDYLAVGWFGPVSGQVTIIDSPYLQPWTGEPK